MLTWNKNRTESPTQVRVLSATAVFLAMVGYALSTQVGAVDESQLAIPAIPAAGPDLSAAVYFPAQYVNQAKDIEQHIEAF